MLATLLLFQLSYHTLHVFTSHLPDSHLENTRHETQVDKTVFNCELCAKLLGKTVYLWLIFVLLVGVFVSLPPLEQRQLVQSNGLQLACLLRGPPVYPF